MHYCLFIENHLQFWNNLTYKLLKKHLTMFFLTCLIYVKLIKSAIKFKML